MLNIALHSAWNRRSALLVAMIGIALSIALLLGVERLRSEARGHFAQSVSGTDLIVGARSSPLQLMLYAVFRIGEATQNMGWDSYQHVAAHPAVAWAVPISLGDSHRSFPVMGTTPEYFDHFRYADRQALQLREGTRFAGVFEAVLGAEVARELGYRVGQRITLSHGLEQSGLAEHADKPFTIVGILNATGTPVDRTVHISLAGMEAIHLDWQGGAPIVGLSIPAEHVAKFNLQPKSVTAALVGLKSRAGVFRLQRDINNSPDEALMAVLPGVALDQLWEIVGAADRTLFAVSALVLFVSLAGLIAVLLGSLNGRRRELAILRAVGARPVHILALLMMESLLVTVLGCAFGVALLALAGQLGESLLAAQFGLHLPAAGYLLSLREIGLLALAVGAALISSLLPAWQAYRMSLSDGLAQRV